MRFTWNKGVTAKQSVYTAPPTHVCIHTHTSAHIHIHTYIYTHMYICRQTDRQTDRQTHTHTHTVHRQTHIPPHTCIKINTHITHTNAQSTQTQTDIQTYRQTHMLHRQTDLFHSQHSIHWPLVSTDSTSQLVTSPVIHQSIGPTTMGLILLLVKHHTQHCSGWATFAKHTSLGCEPSTCIGKNQIMRLIVNISWPITIIEVLPF